MKISATNSPSRSLCNLQALYLALRGDEILGVVAEYTLAAPGAVGPRWLGFRVLAHPLFEDLLQDGLDALPDPPGIHVSLHGWLEFLLRSQVCLLTRLTGRVA